MDIIHAAMIPFSPEQSVLALNCEKQLPLVHVSMCLDGLVLEKVGTILSSAPILLLNEPRSLHTAKIAALVLLQMLSHDVSWAIEDC